MTAPLHAPYNPAVFDARTMTMSDHGNTHPNIAPVERRVDAIEAVFDARGFKPSEAIEAQQHRHLVVPESGASARESMIGVARL